MTLKELRLSKGLNHGDIRRIGYSSGNYSKLENGSAEIPVLSFKNAILLADLFGLSDPCELLDLDPPETV